MNNKNDLTTAEKNTLLFKKAICPGCGSSNLKSTRSYFAGDEECEESEYRIITCSDCGYSDGEEI